MGGEAWTMLHAPYTLMVLSFVLVGAALSPKFSWEILAATVTAYVAGLGVGAHFLDQLPGMGSRYVRHWPSRALWAVGLTGIGAGAAIGILGAIFINPLLVFFVAAQVVPAIGYPLAPVFGRLLHRDVVFAVSWGALPTLTAFFVQSGQISGGALIASAAFALLALIEIRLSKASRQRRQSASDRVISGNATIGAARQMFRAPDLALQALSAGTVVIGLGSLAIRFVSGI